MCGLLRVSFFPTKGRKAMTKKKQKGSMTIRETVKKKKTKKKKKTV